jgi:hypothetical protein
MSELKRIKVIVKNYDVRAQGDLDILYERVRFEDEQGNTLHFKEVVMLQYLKRQGAMATNVPVVWYYKNLSKKSIVVIACELPGRKADYDIDDMARVAKSSVVKGIVIALASIPGGMVAATATFGLGLVIIPLGLWYGYRSVFKLPAMLRRRTLVEELAGFGVTVR